MERFPRIVDITVKQTSKNEDHIILVAAFSDVMNRTNCIHLNELVKNRINNCSCQSV